MSEERIPVIVGVGQINDRPEDPAAGLDSLELMTAALRLADADAGGGWLGDVDSIDTVDQVSFPDIEDIARALAEAVGAHPRRLATTDMPHGSSPIRLLDEAAARIGAGESRIAVVAGGEGLRTAGARASGQASGSAILRNMRKRKRTEYRTRYKLIAPTDMYPLYENALRAKWGQSLAEGQAESALIWSKLAEVAAANPAAWLNRPASPEAILSPEGGNRWISFPYRKLMVANASVNQGAAFIVTSLAEARRRGVPEARIVHVGHGAGATESHEMMERDRYDHSPSLEATIGKTLDDNAVAAADLSAVELYSCFPCVPKMARRVLGWPADRPTTVFGGLTFGGAPVANYMSHAVASMVETLRGGEGKGLLFANGGIVTNHHAIVLSGAPLATRYPHDNDANPRAAALRGETPPLDEDFVGPATVESYTVHYERDGAVHSGVVVARTPDGARTLAKVPAGADEIAWLTDGSAEPVGAAGRIAGEDRVFVAA